VALKDRIVAVLGELLLALAATSVPPLVEIVSQASSVAAAAKCLKARTSRSWDLAFSTARGADLIPDLQATNPGAQAPVLSSTYDLRIATRAIECRATANSHLGQAAPTVRRILGSLS
jgi:hypothetical protein